MSRGAMALHVPDFMQISTSTRFDERSARFDALMLSLRDSRFEVSAVVHAQHRECLEAFHSDVMTAAAVSVETLASALASGRQLELPLLTADRTISVVEKRTNTSVYTLL